MCEVVGGLKGGKVHVVADDIVVVEFVDTQEEAVLDQDQNLEGILQ